MTPYERTQQIKSLSEILKCKVPLDGFLTALFQTPIIDIIALDKKLFGRYSTTHQTYFEGSFNELVAQEYGQEALTILERLEDF